MMATGREKVEKRAPRKREGDSWHREMEQEMEEGSEGGGRSEGERGSSARGS